MNSIDGKTILITGGTGTIGRVLAKHIIFKYDPKEVIILSRGEYTQCMMQREWKGNSKISFVMADIRDEKRLDEIMKGVDIVIHTAALKHVHMGVENPTEVIKTNIDGTDNINKAAIKNNVEKVLFISSDKAVYPVNLYGATKMIGEKLTIGANRGTKTIFSCVRSGNVIGSRGSIVPLFNEQKKRGELTITEKDMTRFWVTPLNIVQFIIKSISLMRGGEIFILKLPSSNIMTMAKAIAPDAKIRLLGAQKGERLHEVLISKEESVHCIEDYDYFVIKNEFGKSIFATEFEYASNNKECLLNVKQLKELLKQSESI